MLFNAFGFADAMQAIYDRRIPRDETQWHRWKLFVPTRTIDGHITSRVWRRRRNGQWEYSQRKQTQEEYEDAVTW